MYINETLANGLKERLWNEIDDLGDGEKYLSKYIKTHKLKLGTRTAYRKLDQAFQIGYEHNILAVQKGGTRECPLLFYAILDRNRQEELNAWKEKMFLVKYVSIDVWGKITHSSQSAIRIGEHAVSRVFQRHPDIYDLATREFKIFNVIPEFKSIAFFGQSMIMLFSVLTKDYKHSFDNISIPFVTDSGIFLGSFNKQLNTCDVRTFIANHQLSPNQVEVATQFRTIYQNEIFKGLPFVAHLRHESGNFIELYLLLAKLNLVARQFSELVTYNEVNLVYKREFNNITINHLKEFEPYNKIFDEFNRD